jgi:hypothetical protein
VAHPRAPAALPLAAAAAVDGQKSNRIPPAAAAAAGLVVVEPPRSSHGPAAPPGAARRLGTSGPRGGRPLAAGNKGRMAPRRLDQQGRCQFGCRSITYTGVYKCKRKTERWRTQFSYGSKVGLSAPHMRACL